MMSSTASPTPKIISSRFTGRCPLARYALPKESVIPDQPLYHPAWHVPYQLDLAARGYVLRRAAVIADPGTGKTHIAMAVAAAGIAFGDIDVILVVCEKGKLRDWLAEFAASTSIGPVVKYYGDGRDKRLAKDPKVIVTTYETARSSLIVRRPVPRKKRPQVFDGPLLTWLAGHRVLIVWDEAGAKLKNRSSDVYKAQARLVARLEKTGSPFVFALTATPAERDWESAFNMLSITGPPGYMPLVKDFEHDYVSGRDDYGRARYHDDRMPVFAARAAPRILRKRKSDPDVRDQFPPKTEVFERTEMREDQARLYRMTEDLAWDGNKNYDPPPGLAVILRQLAGHPASLLHGKSQLAQLMVEKLGSRLTGCSSAKTELLMSYLSSLLDADLKSIVFTFFGQTVLRVLSEELQRAGMPVFIIHGQMSSDEQHRARELWRTASGGAVLACSDAVARGVNLPEAASVIEYESAVTHATRQQRFDRAHRLGRGEMPLTCVTMVLEGTCEVPLLKKALDRNVQQDVLLGDDSDEARADGYVTGQDRKWMFAVARKRQL